MSTPLEEYCVTRQCLEDKWFDTREKLGRVASDADYIRVDDEYEAQRRLLNTKYIAGGLTLSDLDRAWRAYQHRPQKTSFKRTLWNGEWRRQ